jgi:hypothetical protein
VHLGLIGKGLGRCGGAAMQAQRLRKFVLEAQNSWASDGEVEALQKRGRASLRCMGSPCGQPLDVAPQLWRCSSGCIPVRTNANERNSSEKLMFLAAVTFEIHGRPCALQQRCTETLKGIQCRDRTLSYDMANWVCVHMC